MATVRLEKVEKVFKGGVKAVAEMTVDMKDGEFTVLVGPSGCGKTTTLRMVAGLDDPTSGAMFIDNQPVNDVPAKARDIAMVFQNYALYPHMTVRDNLGFALRLRKFQPSVIEQRVAEAAEILGLEQLLERKPGQLSGGQKQRVAVGRAIVRKPKVFLFDEPLSNLDAKLRNQMRAELKRLHTRLGATMIYVTHDQIEAMTLADSIIIMKSGVVQQIGSPMTIYNRPANKFVAGFIGTPPMNFLAARVVKAGDQLYLDVGAAKLKAVGERARTLAQAGYADKAITLGVRPEDIHDRLFQKAEAAERSLKATVEVVEPMGSEIQCILRCGTHEIIAKFKPDSQVGVGDDIELAIDMDRIHLFDAASEQRID